MGTRVPVQHYNLRSASSFIGSSLHDLNTIDSRPTDMEGISDVDRDAVDGDSLDNDEDSSAVPQNQQQNKHHLPSLSHQPQFHPIHQNHHQPIHQSQHAAHFHQNHQCGPPSHIPDIAHAHQSPTISQHMACLQPLAGGHVGGRLHVMPTSPAKFCDECGVPYLRETSKFCSECGVKRLGI
ncbi:uncharacterized protein At2g02148 isoform X4 [Carica papaya]|uniref:uncharacterized protein At2g02148 isoform X4 n=1 Tax=Carica papaya TaxID=3649 RepID=UPI000B8C88EF|nr:uncharacterized protein At2g02148 isoform X4 [Carica papaya]XP_021909846.1 uncharacterized protein At2g02148 isoform X4 [Carica papaya]